MSEDSEKPRQADHQIRDEEKYFNKKDYQERLDFLTKKDVSEYMTRQKFNCSSTAFYLVGLSPTPRLTTRSTLQQAESVTKAQKHLRELDSKKLSTTIYSRDMQEYLANLDIPPQHVLLCLTRIPGNIVEKKRGKRWSHAFVFDPKFTTTTRNAEGQKPEILVHEKPNPFQDFRTTPLETSLQDSAQPHHYVDIFLVNPNTGKVKDINSLDQSPSPFSIS